MTIALILLTVMVISAIYVLRKKSKSQINQTFKIEEVVLPEIDVTPYVTEKQVDFIEPKKAGHENVSQPKKKRKYNKKKHPKKMDANKK